ncbi:zona pellucida-binding protein 2 isoform X5 [Rhinoderma darwinii]|uniref:zona pellucida-binding protein 2 isoform X5 n=1 Tax=Rhinoderma darwinii TaxID=43563 RepID=UPI003F67FAC5
MGRRCPLLSALCHLFALVFVVQVKSTEIHIPPLVTKHFIYGDLNHKVNVYVKMLKESPFLACMDLGIANEVTVDPFFLWVGPDGRNLKGHSNVNLTETGKLMLKAFEKSMSGSYSCTLSYKRIKNDVTQEREKYKSYEFAVFVNPFSRVWDKECSSKAYGCQKETTIHMEKAKNLIVEFFRMQSRVLEEEFVNIPEINYIEHSLDIIRVDSCRPGFGKNEVTHSDCPGCCVVCSPGTYSTGNSIQCEICKDIKITYYGATEC